jgi:hypothetical protein
MYTADWDKMFVVIGFCFTFFFVFSARGWDCEFMRNRVSGFSVRPLEMPSRRPVVFVVAVGKKPDSAAKRARQAEKRRVYNKSHKSEITTRMRKVV